MSQVSSGLTGIQYALRMQRNSGSTDTNGCWYGTTLETKNSIPLAGKVVTFSFYYRTGANYSPTSFAFALYSGTGTDENWANGFTGQATILNTTISPTASSGWLRYSGTASVGSTATEIGLQFTYTPTGTALPSDYIDITGVQLEIGSTATAFSRAGGTIQGELAACQRYYQLPVNAIANGTSFATTVNYSSTGSFAVIPMQVPSRTSTPTVAIAAGTIGFSGNGGTISGTTISAISNSQFTILSTGTSFASWGPALLNSSNATPLTIAVQNEL